MPRSNEIPSEIFSLPTAPLCRPFFLPTEVTPPSLGCFPIQDLWKIKENYVNYTAFAESRERYTPKEESLESGRKMQRVVEAWGVASSGISPGNLWIIPTILMKVVRIRNAEIQAGWGVCVGGTDVEIKTKGKWKEGAQRWAPWGH